jgi:hypothetical protein
VEVKARDVVVTGPLGTLRRAFKFIAMDIVPQEGGKEIKVDIWFGTREAIASIR